MFGHHGWHHHHHHHGFGGWYRRPFWGPRPYYRPIGCCGCLPLFVVLGMVGLMLVLSMCSGPHYYWY